jgi:SnoaL-like domain
MSGNVQIAKRVIDAFNDRDLDAMFECVNEDVEWFPAMPVTFGGGALRGRAGIESYIREVNDTWEEYSVVGHDSRSWRGAAGRGPSRVDGGCPVDGRALPYGRRSLPLGRGRGTYCARNERVASVSRRALVLVARHKASPP